MNNKGSSIIISGGILFGVVLVSVLLLVVMNKVTEPQILQQKELEISNSLQEVLPKADSFSEMIKGTNLNYFEGFMGGQICGYAFMSSAKGYSGDIEVMVGVDSDYKILGLKVIRHTETPGLGSKIGDVTSQKTLVAMLKGKKFEKESKIPWFCAQFIDKKDNELEVVKVKDSSKIEAITGATISSKAVTLAVKNGIELFKKEV